MSVWSTARGVQGTPRAGWREAAASVAWRRFARHRGARAGLGVIVAFAVLAAAAPIVAPYGPTAGTLAARLSPPSGVHWLGTDQQGRDLLSRIIYGGRVSLLIGVIADSCKYAHVGIA